MPKAGDCSSSGGGGRRSGDAKDLPLLFLRVSAAIALSVAGLFFSRLRSQRPRQLLLPPPPSASESDDSRGMKGGGGGLKEELMILKNKEDTKAKIINGNSVLTTTTTALVSLPPKCRSLADDEGFLLPEFNEMVRNEFGRDVGNIITSPAPRVREDASKDHEICKLRDMVRSLQEREKTLELQLLEFYGLQEQDSAVRELENQLKINNVESKLYSLKIESLHSENQRILTQLSESSKLISELEATRAKCKLLKKKLRLDAEQAKEKITSLQQMVDSLQCKETIKGKVNSEVEKKLERLEELDPPAPSATSGCSRHPPPSPLQPPPPFPSFAVAAASLPLPRRRRLTLVARPATRRRRFRHGSLSTGLTPGSADSSCPSFPGSAPMAPTPACGLAYGRRRLALDRPHLWLSRLLLSLLPWLGPHGAGCAYARVRLGLRPPPARCPLHPSLLIMLMLKLDLIFEA